VGRTVSQQWSPREWLGSLILGRFSMPGRLRARGFAFALSVFLITITASWATDQTITLTLGTGSAFLLERRFKTVLIGDPNVVDVVTRGERSVIFEPLNPGATNVVFVDERSIAIINVGILVCKASATRIVYLDSPDCGVDKKNKPQ
jgi:Flp pilus assembly secretin CpaC